MDKCNCWEEIEKATGYYKGFPMEVKNKIQICNGTKEREECSCNGNPEKCTFYPEKRKENKVMNTAEMYLQAINDGKFYRTSSSNNDKIFYQKDRGLFEEDECSVSIQVWDCFEDLMVEQWELCDMIMTRTEAEQKFNIKIID